MKAYDIGELDGYMLWPVYLDENSAAKPDLDGFLKFVRNLSGYGKPVYGMYGGLFSFMMLNHGMPGASHSICYGEHRIPFTGQGMMSTVRFYQPDLHSKIPLSRKEEVEKALSLRSCDCVHCARLGGAENDMALAGKHFLKIRESEVS